MPPEPGKTRITIRLDNKILDHFRKRVHEMGGGNYQTLINDALREHIRSGGIEAAVRRAVREELKEAGIKRGASNTAYVEVADKRSKSERPFDKVAHLIGSCDSGGMQLSTRGGEKFGEMLSQERDARRAGRRRSTRRADR